jgi:hypothetical protein
MPPMPVEVFFCPHYIILKFAHACKFVLNGSIIQPCVLTAVASRHRIIRLSVANSCIHGCLYENPMPVEVFFCPHYIILKFAHACKFVLNGSIIQPCVLTAVASRA